MNRIKQAVSLLGIFVLVACVTININFPAAQATDIADKIVNDIYKTKPKQTKSSDSSDRWTSKPLLIVALDWVSSPAHAVDIDASSPEVRRIQAQLKARNGELASFYSSGAVGLTHKGMLTVRDKKAVPLKSRAKVKKIVKADNKDRLALYKSIASASGHPEWTGKLQMIFAKKWVENGQAGLWYQDRSGNWKQK